MGGRLLVDADLRLAFKSSHLRSALDTRPERGLGLAGRGLGMRRHYERWLRVHPLQGFTATSQLASICWRCPCVLWNDALTRPSDGGKSMTRNVTRNLFE